MVLGATGEIDPVNDRRSTSLPMSRRSHLPLIASLLVAACLGAGGGALLYRSFSDSSSKTVVHDVTVPDSQPASSTSPLSINEIYRRTNQGIVEITASSIATTTFGGPQQPGAQGSCWCYSATAAAVTAPPVPAG